MFNHIYNRIIHTKNVSIDQIEKLRLNNFQVTQSNHQSIKNQIILHN
ncbi:MAG: hypothetical protein Q8S84_09630 [bacterium]|nr:hypothetical protein [bacterium]